MSLAANASRCVSATFGTPTLLGASILAVQASLVENYSFDVPKGWTYSQPVLNVENATFCNVTVTYTHPGQNDSLTAEAWLPTVDRYNGILQAVGGGGWNPGCFILSYAAMINAVANGYAAVTTDAGIPTTTNPIDWLLKSPGSPDTNALQNFGQVSLNDEAVVTKQLIVSFYGKPPTRSYSNASSQGGRQGLKLAQQYPDAYDGIMSAAPATQQFQLGCELDALTALAISTCDELDGVKDGLISDPEACRANPNDCATAANVANASWTGPRSSTGRFIHDGYEIDSNLSIIAPTECTGKVCKSSAGEANVAFAWQAFVAKDSNATVPKITNTTFDTIHHAAKLVFASNMETDETDLTDFKNAGGKIITYHGLADQSISPGGTLRYYNTVADVVEGNITFFYKYYHVPGLEHCWGGRGGAARGYFRAASGLVENGTELGSSPVTVTLSNGSTQKQMLCPYPQKARFDGGFGGPPQAAHADPGCTCTTCHIVKRRPHKKSRDGYDMCKKRRIKARSPSDFTLLKSPTQLQLRALNTKFRLGHSSYASHDAFNRLPHSHKSKTNKGRHNPPQDGYSTRHNHLHPSGASSAGTPSHTSSPCTSTSTATESLPLAASLDVIARWTWTVDELALLHHFLTCPALDHGDATIWRQKVPLLAFENHSVLHLLLAMSAFHLATIKPDERARYQSLADKHYETGLRQTMEIMPRLGHDTAGVLYIAATLVRFSRGPAPGNLLIVSHGVEVAWFELLRGVRLVIETVGFEAIFSGVLGPILSEEGPSPSKDPSGQVSVSASSSIMSRLVTWEPALGRITQLVADSADSDQGTYRKTIDFVSLAFKQTFRTSAEPISASEGKMEVMMACIYRTDDFVRCLKEKKSIALLLLGHFAVLVRTLEWLWYMRGCANHILRGVASNLDAPYLDFLQWPSKEIERLDFDVPS
ncbi:hypothetical protein CSAL01_02842 [Colletotrichum salicis]|uniref:Carboxylic ester hydrolase n=1 Tax=Colletotrichum salicis TaxID=1209931 RepID=A0A135SIA5_9PEZI|nr:hypothetical protein CSAL01_02842 [Colletotrichum salicis]